MIFQQLSVVLTESSLEYLRHLFSGNHMELHPEEFECILVTCAGEPIQPDMLEPQRVYRSTTTHFKPWYDQNLGTSSLILTLESPELAARVQEFGNMGIGDAFYEYYNPYVVCIQRMPPLSFYNKRAIRSLSNVFGKGETVLEFTGENLQYIELDENCPPQYSYIQAMIRESQGLPAIDI